MDHSSSWCCCKFTTAASTDCVLILSQKRGDAFLADKALRQDRDASWEPRQVVPQLQVKSTTRRQTAQISGPADKIQTDHHARRYQRTCCQRRRVVLVVSIVAYQRKESQGGENISSSQDVACRKHSPVSFNFPIKNYGFPRQTQDRQTDRQKER